MSTFYITPYKQRESLFNFYDHFFNDYFYDHRQPSNITETENEVQVQVDLPGFEKSEITVEYKENNLVITAKSEHRNDVKYQFSIPNIELNSSSAELTNGVLTIKLDKSANSKKQTLKIK
ncbi:MAG: Hsp20/alpha crystallin family protein [Candidatus Margulisiibacteriota bacterium]